MVKHVDDLEKAVKTFNTLGGIQDAWALTEDGIICDSKELLGAETDKRYRQYG